MRVFFVFIVIFLSFSIYFIEAIPSDIEVITSENRIYKTSKIDIIENLDKLEIKLDSGDKIDCFDVLRINFGSTQPLIKYNELDVKIEFTNQDIVYGVLGEKVKDKIKVSSKCFGVLEPKFEHIKSLKFLSNSPLIPKEDPQTRGGDIVIVKTEAGTADRYQGTVKSIGSDGLLFKLSIGNIERNFKPSEIIAIYLMEMVKTPADPQDLFAVISGIDCSTLKSKIKSLEKEMLSIETLYGNLLKIPTTDIAHIFFKNGRVVYLSDLEPTGVNENANYIRGEEPSPGDLSFPYQRNANVKGGKLSIRGKIFDKGLGVHSMSEITYKLDKKYQKFLVTLGIDDCAEGKGNVTFEIFVDGKRQYYSGNVTGKDSPRNIEIPLKDAQILKLVVDFGEEFNIRDYADWADARLLK